jgi:hypothetical protein
VTIASAAHRSQPAVRIHLSLFTGFIVEPTGRPSAPLTHAPRTANCLRRRVVTAQDDASPILPAFIAGTRALAISSTPRTAAIFAAAHATGGAKELGRNLVPLAYPAGAIVTATAGDRPGIAPRGRRGQPALPGRSGYLRATSDRSCAARAPAVSRASHLRQAISEDESPVFLPATDTNR